MSHRRATASAGACLAATVGLAALSGCAARVAAPICFPPPPATPRLAYLGRLDELPVQVPGSSPILAWLRGEPAFPHYPFARPLSAAAWGRWLAIADASLSRVVVFDFEHGRTRVVAPLARPVAVAFGPDGTLYSAEADAHRITASSLSRDASRLIAGPTPAFRPIALAVSADTLFAADAADHCLYATPLPGGEWRIVFRGATCGAAPAGVCAVGDQLWLSDALLGRLLRGSPAGSFAAVAARAIRRPRQLACDDRGAALCLVDAAEHMLHVCDASGAELVSARGRPLLAVPTGVCLSRGLLPYFRGFAPASLEPDAVVFVANAGPPAGIGVFLLAAR
ncbi:MAG: hypothetical protein U1A27_11950 [Phycisphaerae bacterium]